RRVIRVETEACRREGIIRILWRLQTSRRSALPVKLEAERFAEGCQRAFGGIGLGGFERHVVHFARSKTTTFARAMPFADNDGAIGAYGKPHLGDIDGDKAAAALARKNTAGFDRFAAPAVEAEDSVGFRDGKPTLDIGEFAAMRLARADLPVI